MRGKKVSVVAPVFNEGSNVVLFADRVAEILRSLPYSFEILLVNDGSDSETVRALDAACARHAEIGVLHLSRNFGHQAALTAGLDHATGDAVVVMDSDLEHPPELIPEMLKMWENGHDVVYTIRDDAGKVGLAKRLTSRAFYRVFNAMSEVDVPANAADFRLMDRAAVEAFRQLRERARFLRGLSRWIGFSQVGIPFQQGNRPSGRSKFGLARMLRLGADGLLSMSTLPLRATLFLGFMMSFLSFCYMVYVIVAYFVTDRAIVGWSSLLVAIVFLGGLQINTIGVAGLYIAKIYEEVKQRPIYIVKRKSGFLSVQ